MIDLYRTNMFGQARLFMGMCVLLALACKPAWGGSTDSESPIELLMVGTFHGNEISAASGEKWLALTKYSPGTRLIEAQIQVKSAPGPYDGEGEATAKKVLVDNSANVLFLTRGSPRFKTGPVQSFLLNSKVLGLESTVEFRGSNGTVYGLGFRCPKSVPLHAQDFGKCALVLKGEQKTQEIGEAGLWRDPTGKLILGDDPQINVIWAGDLDGDGRPDLLVNLTTHYNVWAPTLFLSSAAKKGDMVGKVAEFVSYGD